MSTEYYINVIDQQTRKEVQIFEKSDFTLINSITFEDANSIKFIWVESPEEPQLIGLISSHLTTELVYISPLIGITDRHDVEDVPVVDIAYFNDTLFGCFDGGIINLTTVKVNKFKKGFQQIVVGEKLYLHDTNHVYSYEKGKLKEIGEYEVKKIEVSGDKLIIITADGAVIDDELIPGLLHRSEANGHVFDFYNDKVTVDSSVNIVVENGPAIDVFFHGKYNLVSKSGPSVDVKSIELVPQTVSFNKQANGHVATPQIMIPSIPVQNNLPSDKLLKQVTKNIDEKTSLFQLIESNDDLSNIRLVVSKLSNDIQVKLFGKIVSRLTKQPLKSANVSIWFRALMAANPSLMQSISTKKAHSLSKALQESVTVMPELLSIKGKLGLMASQNVVKKMDIEVEFDQEDETLVVVNGEDEENA